VSTACTYPQPWLSRVPPVIAWPLPELAAAISASVARPRSAAVPSPSTARATRRLVRGWLLHSHWTYVGTYGHLLLGNFTVSFRPSDGTLDGGSLLFQVIVVLLELPICTILKFRA